MNNKQYSDQLEYVRRVCAVTGKDAALNTEPLGIVGTDLGIPFADGEDLYLLFGDTFSEFWQKGRWINNCIAKVKETDGERFAIESFLTEETGLAKELVAAKKVDKEQMTCIPTGAVAIDGVFYMFVMSIVTWQPRWTIEECALYISTDKGRTWQKSDNVAFTKEAAPNFGQVFPFEIGEYVYLFGITEARDGACKLARVPKKELDNFEKYEYYIGEKENIPCFLAGKEGLAAIKENADSVIIPAPCGEMCITYNEYLKKYLAVYIGTDMPDIVYRTADEPWGEWSEAQIVALQSDYEGLYGGFTHRMLTKEGGRRVFFMMSEWKPYNVSLFELKFK